AAAAAPRTTRRPPARPPPASVLQRTGTPPTSRRRRSPRTVPAGIRGYARAPPRPQRETPAPPREPGRRRGLGSSHGGRGGNQVALLEVGEQLLGRLLGRLVFGVGDEVRVLGHLVGVRDAGEFLDLAGERFRVEALDVALGTGVDRRLDVDLDEAVA